MADATRRAVGFADGQASGQPGGMDTGAGPGSGQEVSRVMNGDRPMGLFSRGSRLNRLTRKAADDVGRVRSAGLAPEAL